MKQSAFMIRATLRAQENSNLINGGMPKSLQPIMWWFGLHFWIVALPLSLLITLYLWIFHYFAIMTVTRIMIWR